MAALHSAHFIKEGKIKRKVWDLQEEWVRAEAGAAEKNKIEEGRFCGDLSVLPSVGEPAVRAVSFQQKSLPAGTQGPTEN